MTPEDSAAGYRLTGALAAAAAAVLFACKGIIAKFAYARGIPFETLSIVRALLAVPLFWGFAFTHEPAREVLATPWRPAAAAAFAGFICYYAGTLIDFYALTLIDASIERVLIFSYPAMVVAASAALRREWPPVRVMIAVGLTWIGIFLAVGGFDAAALSANLVGAACVLAAALSYAIYFMIGERCTRQIGASRFTLYAMSAAAAALLVHGILRRPQLALAQVDATGWWLLALLAVFCMFVPALLQAEGVRRIGAQRGALVSTAGPPATILLAWLVLGERLAPLQLAGVGLIVGGILVLDVARLRRRGPPAGAQPPASAAD